jgi:hypothetical protein
MNKFFDVGYFLPFISGYRSTKIKGSSDKKIREFLKTVNDDLRSTIENATPAFFYYKPSVYEQAIKEFVNDLLNGTDAVNYIQSVESPEGKVYREDSGFLDALKKCLSKYQVPNIVSIDIDIKKKATLQQFSGIIESNFRLVQQKIDTSKNPRFLISAAGKKIRSEFSRLTPCILQNPEQLVVGFSSEEQLIVGSTFSTLRDAINTKLTPAVIKSFERAGIVLSDKDKPQDKSGIKYKRFTVGSIVVFGHTGAKGIDDAGISQPLGIVTPWVQQLMLLAGQKSTEAGSIDIVNSFYRQSGHAEFSIQFTKNVSGDVSTLLQGQMAFIIPMTHPTNKELVGQETVASDTIIKNIFGEAATYRSIRKTLIGNILSRTNLFSLITGLKFSPTILQSLEAGLASTIKTGKFKSSKSKSPKAEQIFDVNNIIKSSINTSVKKVQLPKVSIKSTAKATTFKPTISNLTNLQNLLNANLVAQVKRNMGNGTRRDVLNLQTGRFAESVEVTKLSESRQGMITAFYTYMKNPYATFSAGGRQEYPRSRDPKALISKSIREIAAEQVSNRLRSVLV